jgi:hypothetical protein
VTSVQQRTCLSWHESPTGPAPVRSDLISEQKKPTSAHDDIRAVWTGQGSVDIVRTYNCCRGRKASTARDRFCSVGISVERAQSV